MKFQTQYNRDEFLENPREEAVDPVSVTIPDQSMSVAEIMRRYARGLSTVGMEKDGQYYGESFVPDVSKMDLSEIQDMRETLSSKIAEMQKQLQEQERKKRLLDNEKLLQQKIEDFKKEEKKKRFSEPKEVPDEE